MLKRGFLGAFEHMLKRVLKGCSSEGRKVKNPVLSTVLKGWGGAQKGAQRVPKAHLSIRAPPYRGAQVAQGEFLTVGKTPEEGRAGQVKQAWKRQVEVSQ